MVGLAIIRSCKEKHWKKDAFFILFIVPKFVPNILMHKARIPRLLHQLFFFTFSDWRFIFFFFLNLFQRKEGCLKEINIEILVYGFKSNILWKKMQIS